MTDPRRHAFGLGTGLLAGLVVIIVLAGLGIDYVPVVDPPKPPWPSPCDMGTLPRRSACWRY